MPRACRTDPRSRVLILAPVGRDSALTQSLLRRAAIESHVCSSLADLQPNLVEGAGAGVIAEEALIGQDISELVAWIGQQPSWSDFPFIILLEPGASAESGGQERDVLQRGGQSYPVGASSWNGDIGERRARGIAGAGP